MFYKTSSNKVITLKSADSFKEVETEWRSILPPNHHLQCKDVEALEHSMPADIHFKYVSIYENGTLSGVMYLQCLKFNRKHYDHTLLDRPLIKPLKNFIINKTADILVCGNIFRVNFQGFYFKDKADKEKIFDVLKVYRKMVRPERDFCGILVKDCSREFSSIQFGCHGFKAFNQDLTMELNIDENWNSFDDYIQDLSRKYKQRAVKIVKSLNGITTIDMDTTMIEHEKARMNELYMNIVRQQTLALGILNADYFLQMKRGLGEGFKVFGYYLDDKLVAFSSHIYYVPKQKMEIHYIGLDYTYNQPYNLYFNILFDGIKKAIENKFTHIEMGRTAREAKANAGAHAVENFNYVWLRPGIVRLAMNTMGKWFESQIGDEWKKRNPFKSKANNGAIQATAQEE